MDPLRATIDEFAADGYTSSASARDALDTAATDELSPQNLDGADARSVLAETSLR